MDKTSNLIPMDSETARIRGAKGGKASGKIRRDRRDLRKVLTELLALPAADGTGESNIEAMACSMLRKALAGDVRAAEFLRDTTSGKPTVRSEVQSVTKCRVVFFGDTPDETLEDE